MSFMVNTQTAAINLDRLHAIIKNFREAFPDNFKNTGIEICVKCDGSGLPVQRTENDITFWQPGHYCESCGGLGVKGIKRIYDEYICQKCNGRGCEVCDNKGTLDWIKNITKG